jgi:hypothetical protein
VSEQRESRRARGLVVAMGVGIAAAVGAIALLGIEPVEQSAAEWTAFAEQQAAAARAQEKSGVAREPLARALAGARQALREVEQARDLQGRALLAGRVVAAEDGRPLAGVEVEVRGWPASDARVAAWARPLRWQDPPAQRTDAAGHFAFAFEPLPPLGYDLVARAPNRAPGWFRWHELPVDRAQPPLTVRLALLAPLRLRAQTRDGRPAAGVSVQLDCSRPPAGPGARAAKIEAVSDATGWLDFGAVPAGTIAVLDGTAGGPWSVIAAQRVRLGLQGRSEPDVVLVRALEHKIEGRVVDDTGAVIAGGAVSVQVEGVVLGRGAIEAGGQFVVHRRRSATSAAAPYLVLEPSTRLGPDAAWNAPPRDFVARRPGRIELAVADAGGRAVERFSVRQLRSGLPIERLRGLGGHHPGGCVDLGECPAGELCIEVEPGGVAFGRSGMLRIAVEPASAQRVSVRVAPPRRQRVRVRDADGQPVVRARVAVWILPEGVREPRRGVDVPTWRKIVEGKEAQAWELASEEAGTDGRAELLVPIGYPAFAVVVDAKGYMPASLRVDGATLGDDTEIDVDLQRGATVRGRVLPGDWTELMRALFDGRAGVAEVQAAPVDPVTDWRQSWASTALGGDGSFSMTGLAPGRYRLGLRLSRDADWFGGGVYLPPDPTRRPEVEVRGDATIDCAVDLREWLPGTLTLMVKADGQVAANTLVTLGLEQLWPPTKRQTDAHGRVEFSAVPPGRAVVRVGSALDPEPIELAAGARLERDVAVVSRRLRVIPLGVDGERLLGGAVIVKWLGPVRGITWNADLDAEGGAELTGLPPGEFELQHLAAWPVVHGRFTVGDGAIAELLVPLREADPVPPK